MVLLVVTVVENDPRSYEHYWTGGEHYKQAVGNQLRDFKRWPRNRGKNYSNWGGQISGLWQSTAYYGAASYRFDCS